MLKLYTPPESGTGPRDKVHLIQLAFDETSLSNTGDGDDRPLYACLSLLSMI